jgi:signal transduction histidine kinase
MIGLFSIFIWVFGLFPIYILPEQESIPISQFEYLVDADNDLTPEQIIYREDFKELSKRIHNFGINGNSIWLRFRIKSENLTDERKFLVINNSGLDEAHFFLASGEKIISHQVGGRVVDFHQKIIPTNKIAFELDLSGIAEADVYLKIKSNNSKIFSAYIADLQQVNQKMNLQNILFGIFTGILAGLIVYNSFLFFAFRDRIYLMYSTHTLLLWFAESSIFGYTQELLWPDWEWMNVRSIVIFGALTGISVTLFAKHFLSIAKYTPKLKIGVHILIGIFVFVILDIVFFSQTVGYLLYLLAIGVLSVFIWFIGFRVLRKGYLPARYFIIAWTVFAMGALAHILVELGLIPFSYFSVYILPLAVTLQAILFSFSLADRKSILESEKEKEQYDIMKVLRQNESLIIEQNELLEEKVKQRTEELEYTLHNLQSTQTQMVNQEKMASLGQLTAGIAHEINNPINFVSSNISPLRRDIGDLLEVVELYRKKGKLEFSADSQKEIEKMERDIEFDYILQEIDQLLRGMEDGAKRTVEIVKGLRLFSRVDEQDVKKVDIHDGINSTLVLLNSTMAGKIKIVKEYGNIPLVECLAGKMNQVFMNIITNAIHAMLDFGKTSEPTLTIRTSLLGEKIKIEIEDNGPGMPNHVKQRIFEPFFTTKAVGKGTGLGLSIVYTIIENHKGTLHVETAEGRGTNFIITIPIYQTTPYND